MSQKRPHIIIFNPDEMRADALHHLGKIRQQLHQILISLFSRMQYPLRMHFARIQFVYQADVASLRDYIHIQQDIVQ